MSAEMGRTVTHFVEGRPEVFMAGFTFVFHVLACVAAVGLVLTTVRWRRTRTR